MFGFIIKLTVVTLLIIYGVVPALLYFFPSLISNAVFMTFLYCPLYNDLNNYQHYGLHENHTITFHVDNNVSGLKLGIWYIVPPALEIQSEQTNDLSLRDAFLQTLSSSSGDILFYMHGNALSRGSRTARRLYPRLRNIGMEIISMDYRGYGDSQRGFLDEDTIVSDALSVYKFIRQFRPTSRIFMWGHSLGTGVASSLAAKIHFLSLDVNQAEKLVPPSGIILETPFTTIRDAGVSHPHGSIHSPIPFLFNIILESFARANVFFKNNENLLHGDYPILILHAEDDEVVPISQGRELYKHLQEHGKTVTIKEFPAERKYRHTGIAKAPELESILKEFFNSKPFQKRK
jgi:abhydrolase domain-containing protein 12